MTTNANPQTEDAQEEPTILSRVNKATSRQFESEDELVQWAENANKAIGANEDSKLAQEAKEFEQETGHSPKAYLANQTQANAKAEVTQASDIGTGNQVDDAVDICDMPEADLEDKFEDVVASI